MVAVRLLYPPEKLEGAARLAQAIEAAGYPVERRALADSATFPDLSADAVGAEVVLLIWSRGLATAAMNGGLAEARRRPNLVEVSIDGIEPAFGAENSPVVLLSGWRGQPFHLGWQRILAEIKRLSGPGDPRKGTGKAGAADPAARSTAAPARPSTSGRTSVRAGIAAGALFAATLGAAAVLDWSAPGPVTGRGARSATALDTPPPAASVPAPAAAPSPMPIQAVAGTPAPDAGPAPVEAPIPVQAAGRTPASGTPPVPAAPTGSDSRRGPAAGSGEPVRKASVKRSGTGRTALAAQPAVKRYSRKYSKTMRLFCQRSGRSTPQCRTFARSTRDRRD